MKNLTFGGIYPLAATLVVFAISISVSNAGGANDPEARGRFSPSDHEFARSAAAGGSFEVAAGRVATQKAALPAVKEYGERMVNDHSKTGLKLTSIANRVRATLPTRPTPGQQKEIDRLNELSGLEFDKAYISLMVEDHKKDLKEFQEAAKTTDNAELKAFAAETAKLIEHHLNAAQSLAAQVKAEIRQPEK